MWLILRRKTVFVNINPVLLLCTKRVVYNWSKFSSGFSHFLTCWEKQTFQIVLSFFLTESIIWLKREVFSEIPRKCFKTTEKHSLAVCGSFRGELFFSLYLSSLTGFEQKGLFTTNPNFLLDLLLFKLVEKNKLSQYFWASSWGIKLFD